MNVQANRACPPVEFQMLLSLRESGEQLVIRKCLRLSGPVITVQLPTYADDTQDTVGRRMALIRTAIHRLWQTNPEVIHRLNMEYFREEQEK